MIDKLELINRIDAAKDTLLALIIAAVCFALGYLVRG
jgi:hypothetical protein